MRQLWNLQWYFKNLNEGQILCAIFFPSIGIIWNFSMETFQSVNFSQIRDINFLHVFFSNRSGVSQKIKNGTEPMVSYKNIGVHLGDVFITIVSYWHKHRSYNINTLFFIRNFSGAPRKIKGINFVNQSQNNSEIRNNWSRFYFFIGINFGEHRGF